MKPRSGMALGCLILAACCVFSTRQEPLAAQQKKSLRARLKSAVREGKQLPCILAGGHGRLGRSDRLRAITKGCCLPWKSRTPKWRVKERSPFEPLLAICFLVDN